MAEELRPVPGHEGVYASNTVRVFRRLADGTLREVNQHCQIKWNKPGEKKKKVTTYTHRLVALAFHGEPPEGKHLVRHLDGNGLNNSPENLAWGDDEDNYQDAVRHGVSKARNIISP